MIVRQQLTHAGRECTTERECCQHQRRNELAAYLKHLQNMACASVELLRGMPASERRMPRHPPPTFASHRGQVTRFGNLHHIARLRVLDAV